MFTSGIVKILAIVITIAILSPSSAIMDNNWHTCAIPSVVKVQNFIGAGTGFATHGGIITNAHVIGDDKIVTITDANENVFEGYLVKIDRDNDLAFLDVPVDLPELKVTVEIQQIGAMVLITGYPMSNVLDGPATVSRGMVSARRDIKERPYLQLDANINFGNSGSPVVNEKCEVVGVVRSKVRDSEGMGFAIPGSVLYSFLEDV